MSKKKIIVKYNEGEYERSYNGKLDNDLQVDFSDCKKVPDSIIGYLYVDGQERWFARGIKLEHETTKCKRIALVLESPHKFEFTSNDEPLLPAQGATGNRIAKFITTRSFVSELEPAVYEVCLVNPIQFQASCYSVLKAKTNRSITDAVFKLLYEDAGLKSDFEERLQNCNADYVVNCCTKNLSTLVGEWLKCYGKKALKDCHPSTWRRETSNTGK